MWFAMQQLVLTAKSPLSHKTLRNNRGSAPTQDDYNAALIQIQQDLGAQNETLENFNLPVPAMPVHESLIIQAETHYDRTTLAQYTADIERNHTYVLLVNQIILALNFLLHIFTPSPAHTLKTPHTTAA